MSTYVFELGCEELPSSALPSLRDQMVSLMTGELAAAQLSFETISAIAAPRRLGVFIEGLAPNSETRTIERKGPAVQAAYKEGQPTPALLGFCKGLGIDPADVQTEETDKGVWVVYRGQEPGRPAADLLPGIIQKVLARLSHTKPMRWGSGRDEFPRPVHWILSVLDSTVIPVSAFGLASGAVTYGHRFHSPSAIQIAAAKDYEAQLKAAYVLPFFEVREALTWSLIQDLATSQKLTVATDADLLEEICCLVEWPVPLCGSFEPEFLEVPDIALIAAMRGHQKYFHCSTAQGALSHHFITVANLESRDPNQVIAGNQRVIRARLSDARFFYQTDRQTPLSQRRPSLNSITFHPKLGSLGDKTERLKALASELAGQVGLSVDDAERAAELSRCDLVSEMVLEFDELQGQMGGIYARLDGENDTVSEAIAELYRPAGAQDKTPDTALGALLGLADRLDTLAGLFAAGQPPSGNKDPFALRRAAIGLIRLNMHPALRIDLRPWVGTALAIQPGTPATDSEETLVQFIEDRERVRLTDSGYRHDLVIASQDSEALNTYLTEQRVIALAAHISHPDFDALAGANKRIANILAKSQTQFGEIQAGLLEEPSERVLFESLNACETDVHALVSRETYGQAIERLAQLRPAIDGFFDNVMVNAEREDLKQNRLNLLCRVRALFLLIGDLSLVQA